MDQRWAVSVSAIGVFIVLELSLLLLVELVKVCSRCSGQIVEAALQKSIRVPWTIFNTVDAQQNMTMIELSV